MKRGFKRTVCVLVSLLFSSLSFGEVELNMVLLWEGRDIKQQNVEAIAEFRKALPQIKLLHFIDPAYFVRGTADEQVAMKALETVFDREQDGFGLYLHGWRSTVLAAGASFVAAPRFWGPHSSGICTPDCGDDVPLTMYSREDMKKLITFALQIFSEHSLPQPEAFLASGWLISNDLLKVVSEAGFGSDFSQVALDIVEPTLKGYPIRGWLQNSEPSYFSSQASTDRELGLTRVPFNGATVEYETADNFMKRFRQFIKEKPESKDEKWMLTLGYHQESAYRYLSRVKSIVSGLEQACQEAGISLTYHAQQ